MGPSLSHQKHKPSSSLGRVTSSFQACSAGKRGWLWEKRRAKGNTTLDACSANTRNSPRHSPGGNTVFPGSNTPPSLMPDPGHLLHGLEQRLPVILERHDELELRAPRLHGCRKEGERSRVTGCLKPLALGWEESSWTCLPSSQIICMRPGALLYLGGLGLWC